MVTATNGIGLRGNRRAGPGVSFAVSRLLPVVLIFGCSHLTRVPRTPALEEPALEVMTYNLNYGIAGDEATLQVLAEATAAVVFLQETTPEWERSLRATLTTTFPHQAYVHHEGAGGLAVLARRPFELKDVIENQRGWFPAVRVVAQTAVGPVQAVVVHLRPPVSDSGSWVSGYLTTSPLRRDELKDVLASLEPNLPTLVAGDFNEGTSGDALSELEARGLRSALPEFTPNAKTWGWRVGAFQLSAQLDHIAYSAQLEPVNARVVPGGRSDHQAVTATFVRARKFEHRPAPRGGSLSISVR